MRIVVTGGAGFIGSHVVSLLHSDRNDVLVVDDLSTGSRSHLPREVQLVETQMGHPDLGPLLAGFGPDAIVHCAAQTSVSFSMRHPAIDAQVNIVDGLSLMAAAAGAGVGRFVYLNTGGALYGEPKSLPCREDETIHPISAYGLSKWTLETYLALLLPPEVSLITLRLANVYGPRQNPRGEAGVVAIFADRMLGQEEITIYSDGQQTRDFVHVSDVAQAVRAALACDGRTAINIGSGKPSSVNQIFALLSEITGYGRSPIYAPEREGDVRHVYLKVDRARELLGWQPSITLRDGLCNTVDYLRSLS